MTTRRHPSTRRRATPGDDAPAGSRPAGRKPAAAPRRGLIHLDTQTLRRKALQAHRQAERTLAKLKNQLKRFHEHDLPGFRSWLHRTFGPLLTQQRELQHAFAEKEAFVHELQDIATRYQLSELAAYRKVVWRHAHPAEAEAEDRAYDQAQQEHHDAGARAAGETDEGPALDPDTLFGSGAFTDLSDDEAEAFGAFFEEMTGLRPPSREAPPHRDRKSVKELYRQIVRRLHPDHHGQMDEARKQLWHEAQAAYHRHDLNVLQSILTRCDTGEAGLGAHTQVSFIQRLIQQLKSAATATRREIREGKRNPAWNYEARIADPRFRRDVEVDLKLAIRDLQWTLDNLQAELDRLDRQANRPRRKPPTRRRSTHRPPDDDLSFDLPF